MKTLARFGALLLALGLTIPTLSAQKSLDLDAVTIADVNAAFASGTLTSERLTQMFLARIEAYDRQGPSLRAIITVNPRALETARAMDAERKTKGPRSPLHGIPIILKDNIDTSDLPTTGGSVLLEGSVPPDDAFVVKRLRAAGAVVIAKANLSEFASQSARPHTIAGRLIWWHRRIACGRVRNGRTWHRHGWIGARTVNRERHRRTQDHDGVGQPRRCYSARLEFRHRRADGPARFRCGGDAECAGRRGSR